MMLFERVKELAQKVAESETKLAEKLSIPQRKFNGYLNPISEKNLWQHLPRILEKFPEVSREWLYFGEGEMLAGSSVERVVAAMPTAAAQLQTETQAVRIASLERELKLMQELLASRDELLVSRDALIASRDALIASREEVIAMHKGMRQAALPSTETGGVGRENATGIPARGARTSTRSSNALKE